MIDPKKITAFLNNYYDGLKTILNTNKSKGSLTYEEIQKILQSVEISNKAVEYQFLEEKIDGTFTLRDLHYTYIEAIEDDYTLEMPEQIAKYHFSLTQLYNRLLLSTQKNETLGIINSLGDELQKFEWQLKKNVKMLIKDTQQIKANNENYTYKQKLAKATELSKIYIEPLITILSSHDDSIYSLSKKIMSLINKERYNNEDGDIRNSYKRLYQIYALLMAELSYENKLLNKEVLYFLERIKSESKILSGCINYLQDPEQYGTPKILETKLSFASYREFAKDVYYDTRDIWDGFAETFNDLPILEAVALESHWFYIEEKYISMLTDSLPVEDYYQWVYDVLEKEQGEVPFEAYLELSGILHTLLKKMQEEDRKLIMTYKNYRKKIYTDKKILEIPLMSITEAQYEQ